MWLVFFSGYDTAGVRETRACVNLNPDFSAVEAEVREYANSHVGLFDVYVEQPKRIEEYAVGNIACSWVTR